MKKLIPIIIGLTALIAIWQLAVLIGGYDPELFPSPAKVFSALWNLIREGILGEAVLRSFLRFFTGYLSAAIFAITLGIILGRFQKAWRFVDPIVQFLRPISPIAWLPFVVLWFGSGEIPSVVIVFIAAFFPILLTTVAGVKKIDEKHYRVSKESGLSKFQIITKIIIPLSFPNISTGLHIAIGTAWVFLVVGEMVGVQSGLGFLIVNARQDLRSDLLMSAMVVIGFLGLSLNGLVGMIEKRIYEKWKEKETTETIVT